MATYEHTKIHTATFWISLFIVILMFVQTYQNYLQSSSISTLSFRVGALEIYVDQLREK